VLRRERRANTLKLRAFSGAAMGAALRTLRAARNCSSSAAHLASPEAVGCVARRNCRAREIAPERAYGAMWTLMVSALQAISANISACLAHRHWNLVSCHFDCRVRIRASIGIPGGRRQALKQRGWRDQAGRAWRA